VSIEIEFTLGGVSFKADNLEDLTEIAGNAPEVFKRVQEVKQAGIATSVISAQASKETPDVLVTESTGPNSDGVPSCKHGKMTDLRGKVYQTGDKKGEPYPESFYCNAPKDTPYKEKCKARS
jgi:hypothetical protein